MHWTLRDLYALSRNEYDGLVQWLVEQQRDAEERSHQWA
jgi:hypothetical protein